MGSQKLWLRPKMTLDTWTTWCFFIDMMHVILLLCDLRGKKIAILFGNTNLAALYHEMSCSSDSEQSWGRWPAETRMYRIISIRIYFKLETAFNYRSAKNFATMPCNLWMNLSTVLNLFSYFGLHIIKATSQRLSLWNRKWLEMKPLLTYFKLVYYTLPRDFDLFWTGAAWNSNEGI